MFHHLFYPMCFMCSGVHWRISKRKYIYYTISLTEQVMANCFENKCHLLSLYSSLSLSVRTWRVRRYLVGHRWYNSVWMVPVCMWALPYSPPGTNNSTQIYASMYYLLRTIMFNCFVWKEFSHIWIGSFIKLYRENITFC